MSEELKIIQNEDGTFSEYDDTFDIAIHCQSEEEQNEVLAKLNAQEPCGDCISREAALDDSGLGEFHRYDDYVKMRNYLKSLPSVTPQQKMGYISIDDVMAVFDNFMRGDVDENDTETFLEMLKDKAEGSEE